MTTAVAVTASSNPYINGLLGASKWSTGTTLTYNFPTLAVAQTYYPANYFTAGTTGAAYTFDINNIDSVAGTGTFEEASQAMKDAYAKILPLQFQQVALIDFGAGPQAANATVDISVGRALLPNDSQPGSISGHAYRPLNLQRGGDTWYSTEAYYGGNPANGDFFEVGVSPGGPGWFVMLHEIGHSLGLKHAHEDGAVVPADKDGYEYTVMTYRDFVGDDANRGFDGERYGRPQSLMQLDIQALQYLYGPNYGASAYNTNTVYTFSTTTGQMSINGTPSDMVPGANRIFRTIWDGGGTDTYDLSNYTTNLKVDLHPGAWSTFDASQLAILETATGRRAIGNVANALLFDNNPAGLIENAIGGTGNDLLIGNDAGNVLTGNAGNDTISSGIGLDVLHGGSGVDILLAGSGNDYVYGGDDGDHIFGEDGLDILYGEGGDDVFYAPTDGVGDYMNGGSGNDYFNAGNGADTIFGGTGIDNISGNGGGDQLYGDADTDFIYGHAGLDTIEGGTGTDYLYGGADADTMRGQDDADFLYGDAGGDTLYGGAGTDYIYGGANTDTLYGEADGDFFMDVGTGTYDNAFGGDGTDYFFIGDKSDGTYSYLDGGPGDDVFIGGSGGDLFIGGSGQNYMWTGGGADVIRNDKFASAGFDVVYDWTDGLDKIQLTGGDTYAGLVSAGRIGYDAVNNNTFILDPGFAGGIILIGINVSTLGAADFS